jgi:hypothetical protein
MQIHEITKKSLREGVLGNIAKTIPTVASGFVQGLTGIDFPRQTENDPKAVDKATRKLARQLAQQWSQQAKTQKKTLPAPGTQAKPDATSPTRPPTSPASPTAQKSALPSITLGNQLLTKGPDGQWRGETGAVVMDPVQAARIDKAYQAREYQKKQFQQTAIIKEAPSEYTTPGGIIVPGSTTTDTKSSGTVDFEQWADQKLTTQVSGTGQPIDLDAVKKDPAVKTELDKVLPQIKKDPANIAAVEQYFLHAMQGMQRMAAQARQSAGINPNATAPGTNPLSKIINDQQLGAIKNLAQNPQTAAVIKQTLGIK